MKRFTSTLLKGLVTALPLALTVYAVYWILLMAETTMSALLKPLLPKTMEAPPGLGVLTGIVLLFCLGTLMNVWLVRKLVKWGEGVLSRIPLVKTIYGGIQDMLGFFARSPEEGEGNQAVAIEIDGKRMLGLVTQEHCAEIPDELATKDDVAVYLPMSYQVGGFTVFVPRESVTPLDLSIEDAMRLALTAGMGLKKDVSKVLPAVASEENGPAADSASRKGADQKC